MAKTMNINSLFIIATVTLTISTSQFLPPLIHAVLAGRPDPTPRPWPLRFHALLYMNLSSTRLQMSDLYYDWPKGRNVNIFQKQLGELLYDVEWNNGTSFYYTGGESETCRVEEFGVGIPRPDFLDGALYLGTAVTDGFLCNVWEKVEFIWYYEDVETKVPVRWDFYDGISTHVFTFEEGVSLEDSVTQAPAYCFTEKENPKILKDKSSERKSLIHIHSFRAIN